jgi:steroid delta-isomerase-like uncharacterized protein
MLFGAALLATAACRQQLPGAGDAIAERNKTLVRRWIDEGFNRRSLAVVDELVAERFTVNGRVVGRDGLKQSMSRHLAGFSDLRVTIDEILAEGPKVGIWYTVEGTHTGVFEAIPPTGARVKWEGFDLFTIQDGKIAHARFLSDVHGLLTQLGAVLSVPEGPARRQP